MTRWNNSNTTVIWLSAFTRGPHLGRVLRTTEVYHGSRMSSKIADFNWILVRETTGYTADGTYYGGVHGLQAEIELQALIESVIDSDDRAGRSTVVMGSSMAAYGAALMGIRLGVSAFCFSPHFDLEVAHRSCGRGPWIDFCTAGMPYEARSNYRNRLQDELLKSSNRKETQILIQVAADDIGVFEEQVIPFMDLATKKGHKVYLDLRSTGGHASIHVNERYIQHVIPLLAESKDIEVTNLSAYGSRKYSRYERIDRSLARVEEKIYKSKLTQKLFQSPEI